jgi:hypothetical protein
MPDWPSEEDSTKRGASAADSLQVRLPAFADENMSFDEDRSLDPNAMIGPRELARAASKSGRGDFAGLAGISGGRMYMECRGSGSPTVVLSPATRMAPPNGGLGLLLSKIRAIFITM